MDSELITVLEGIEAAIKGFQIIFGASCIVTSVIGVCIVFVLTEKRK